MRTESIEPRRHYAARKALKSLCHNIHIPLKFIAFSAWIQPLILSQHLTQYGAFWRFNVYSVPYKTGCIDFRFHSTHQEIWYLRFFMFGSVLWIKSYLIRLSDFPKFRNGGDWGLLIIMTLAMGGERSFVPKRIEIMHEGRNDKFSELRETPLRMGNTIFGGMA